MNVTATTTKKTRKKMQNIWVTSSAPIHIGNHISDIEIFSAKQPKTDRIFFGVKTLWHSCWLLLPMVSAEMTVGWRASEIIKISQKTLGNSKKCLQSSKPKIKFQNGWRVGWGSSSTRRVTCKLGCYVNIYECCLSAKI